MGVVGIITTIIVIVALQVAWNFMLAKSEGRDYTFDDVINDLKEQIPQILILIALGIAIGDILVIIGFYILAMLVLANYTVYVKPLLN